MYNNSMKQNTIFNHINYVLFKSNTEDDIDSDINIYKYFEYKSSNDQNLLDNILLNLNENKKAYEFNYDYDIDQYLNEFYSNLYNIDYYGASFNNNSNGLERSQIKTLSAIKNLIRDNNRYIAINGGPGTGKSTLLNYVISNILIDNMLIGYWKLNNKVDFTTYIKSDKYESIRFLATGSTIASVQNIVDLCKIKLPDNHIWFKCEIYESFMNRLDYSLIDENKIKTINEDLDKYFHNELDKRKSFFIIKAKEYFGVNFIKWESIPNFCYKKISDNCILINNINKNIKSVVDNDDNQIIDECIYQLKINNKLNKIITNLTNDNISDENKKTFLEHSKHSLQNTFNNVKKIFKNNNNESSKLIIDKINELIDNLFDIKKFKLFFKSFKGLKKEIDEIKNLFNDLMKISTKKLNNTFKSIDDSIKILKTIFSNDELNAMGLLDFINFDVNNLNKPNTLLTLASSLRILQMNFNVIQKEIDKKIRSENTYLFRHIQEWLFLETGAKDLSIIWPIISSNIQKFSWTKIQRELWPFKKFDYAIIDESGQTNYKYLLYLNALSNKIIAVGDEKQLETIYDNNELNNKLIHLKDTLNNNEFNNVIDILQNKLKIITKDSNKYLFNEISLLNAINNLSNAKSIINNKKYNGLYLLEHFRCPNQIFNLINEYYYDNMLNYPIKDDYSECSFSKIIGNDICCDQCSLIQLKYKYDNNLTDENGKINYLEIQIGLNFIIDNINLFIEHHNNEFKGIINYDDIKYLQNNIAFVTLYAHQAKKIKRTIKYLILKLQNIDYTCSNKNVNDIINQIYRKIHGNKNIKKICELLSNLKCGTIDSLQGIGCDFIIFSNVSETFNPNEFKSSFEFNPNRINVLWTRTKKHFIHILSNNYWNNKTDCSNDIYSSRFQAEVTSNNNINRVSININKFDNLELSKLLSTNAFDFTNKLKISEIGKYGEMILNSILEDDEMRDILIDKIYNEISIELSSNLTYKWLNKESESYDLYDYLLKSNNNEYFLDVKASIKNSNSFYLSNNEFDFVKNHINNYIILKINDISKYNINVKNKSCLSFTIKNISSFLWDENINRFKNVDSNLFYKLRVS